MALESYLMDGNKQLTQQHILKETASPPTKIQKLSHPVNETFCTELLSQYKVHPARCLSQTSRLLS